MGIYASVEFVWILIKKNIILVVVGFIVTLVRKDNGYTVADEIDLILKGYRKRKCCNFFETDQIEKRCDSYKTERVVNNIDKGQKLQLKPSAYFSCL